MGLVNTGKERIMQIFVCTDLHKRITVRQIKTNSRHLLYEFDRNCTAYCLLSNEFDSSEFF